VGAELLHLVLDDVVDGPARHQFRPLLQPGQQQVKQLCLLATQFVFSEKDLACKALEYFDLSKSGAFFSVADFP
jgi:hypothetical protein